MNIAEFLLPIAQSSATEQIASSISTGRMMTIGSAAGSSALALAATVGMQTRRPMLIVTAHLDEADDAVDQLELFAPGAQAKLFPALEVLPGESNVSPELSAQRLGVLAELKSNRRADFYVAPVQALMQSVPTRESLEDQLRILRPTIR